MSTQADRLPHGQGEILARASHCIENAVRTKQDIAVLLVHVRGVERMCASLGHARTGQVLERFHAQLREMARRHDAIERIGNRKFAVVLHSLRNRGHVSLAAQKIGRLARQCVHENGELAALETTIGVALCPEHGDDAHELLRLAEFASLDGRRRNKSVCFYEVQSARQLFKDWGLEQRLRKALETGSLELHYQPKMCLRTGEIVGAEALMRWHDTEIGSISPDIFIELAETTGQITELTHFAIQRACRQLSEWGGLHSRFGMAVNVTPSTVQDPEIVDVLRNAASIWGIQPAALTLEVTENALMEDPATSNAVLTRIREFGSRVSIDDFGTGHSSLAYLKDIPADELKIDRTFVLGMLEDAGDCKIVRHSIDIARSFGLSVVAEGIESEAMIEKLTEFGCDYAQGYFIGKPVPARVFEVLCRNL